MFVAGQNGDGTQLSLQDATPYTPVQKRVLKQAMQSNQELADEFAKRKGRAAQRMFVNSIIPKDVNYGHRMDPASCTVWMERTSESFKRREDEAKMLGRP